VPNRRCFAMAPYAQQHDVSQFRRSSQCARDQMRALKNTRIPHSRRHCSKTTSETSRALPIQASECSPVTPVPSDPYSCRHAGHHLAALELRTRRAVATVVSGTSSALAIVRKLIPLARISFALSRRNTRNGRPKCFPSDCARAIPSVMRFTISARSMSSINVSNPHRNSSSRSAFVIS
jgi:hypothetical protein